MRRFASIAIGQLSFASAAALVRFSLAAVEQV